MDGRMTVSWSINGAESTRTIVSKTQDAEVAIKDIAITGPVTNKAYTGLAIDVSAIEMISIMCSKDATLKTNSSGSPDNTLTLKAGEPYLWWKNAPWANALTVDITALYLTVAGTGTTEFELACLQDPTP